MKFPFMGWRGGAVPESVEQRKTRALGLVDKFLEYFDQKSSGVTSDAGRIITMRRMAEENLRAIVGTSEDLLSEWLINFKKAKETGGLPPGVMSMVVGDMTKEVGLRDKLLSTYIDIMEIMLGKK